MRTLAVLEHEERRSYVTKRIGSRVMEFANPARTVARKASLEDLSEAGSIAYPFLFEVPISWTCISRRLIDTYRNPTTAPQYFFRNRIQHEDFGTEWPDLLPSMSIRASDSRRSHGAGRVSPMLVPGRSASMIC